MLVLLYHSDESVNVYSVFYILPCSYPVYTKDFFCVFSLIFPVFSTRYFRSVPISIYLVHSSLLTLVSRLDGPVSMSFVYIRFLTRCRTQSFRFIRNVHKLCRLKHNVYNISTFISIYISFTNRQNN